MSEKINFAWPVTAEHAGAYHFFQQKVNALKGRLAKERAVIFGAGIRGCALLHVLEGYGLKNIVFCDNNPEKQNNLIHQYNIISLENALQYEGAQIFLVSPENSREMGLQLSRAGLEEEKDWFSFDFPVYHEYVSEYLRPVNDHLLVMGDCAFSHVSIADRQTDSLGDMLKTAFGGERCKVLAMHGIGQQANHHILTALMDKGEKPKALLLLTVLETLTPKAHLMPRTQHAELIRLLVEATEHPRKEFSEYAGIASERFQRFQVESFVAYQKDQNEASEKLYMRMNYLFKIREETEGVVYLKKTVKMMNDWKIPVILYIPPVNYVQGEHFFGEMFRKQYLENFRRLYEFLDKEQLEYHVVDGSFLLTDQEFAAPNTIDESANYTGRRKLLELIRQSDVLRSIFS